MPRMMRRAVRLSREKQIFVQVCHNLFYSNKSNHHHQLTTYTLDKNHEKDKLFD